MKAMVLAAGLGTRLRPLTNDRPKALVEVAGRTLLELTLTRLRSFGINEVIVNTHHFADLMQQYLAARNNFGMHIEISREDILLDTGGGLKQAAPFFLRDHSSEPFLLHNVDVLSTIDLAQMVRFHSEHNALATLAVQARDTSRPLLFDEHGQLRGRILGDGTTEIATEANQPLHSLAFAGIHVLSPRIFDHLTEQGAFPIVPAYLRLAGEEQPILAFRADAYYWRDLGRPQHIEQAARDLADGTYPAP